MKVLFLDIDGVLISLKSVRMFRNTRTPDPDAIKILNEITDETGAKIVVSSTWRTLPNINEILAGWGVTAGIVGKTPSLGPRGEEIRAWLEQTKTEIDSFVILDDDRDVEPYLGRLVHTSWEYGLMQVHVEDAVRKLSRPIHDQKTFSQTQRRLFPPA